MRLPAVVALLGLFGSVVGVEAAGALTTREAALQAHRAAEHQSPDHHLQEAGRALDRAWRKVGPADRQSLAALRTDVAALALAYSKVPTRGRTEDMKPASGTEPGWSTGTTGTAEVDVPPRTTATRPPDTTSARSPLDWQQKYADVERDLKAFDTSDAALRARVDHLRTHLRMFYAAALGKARTGA